MSSELKKMTTEQKSGKKYKGKIRISQRDRNYKKESIEILKLKIQYQNCKVQWTPSRTDSMKKKKKKSAKSKIGYSKLSSQWNKLSEESLWDLWHIIK